MLDELDCPNAASFKLHYQQKQKEKRQAEEKERLAEKERQKAEEKRLAEEKQLCSHFEIRYNAFQNRIQFFKEIDGKNGERASIQLETKEEAKELEKSSPFFPVVTSIDFSRYKQQGEVAKTKCQAIYADCLAQKNKDKKPPKRTSYKPENWSFYLDKDRSGKRKQDETKEQSSSKIKRQRTA